MTPLVQATLVAGYAAMILVSSWVLLTLSHRRRDEIRRVLSRDPTMSEDGARAFLALVIIAASLVWPVFLPWIGLSNIINRRKKGDSPS